MCSPCDDGQLIVHQARAAAEASRRIMQTIKDSADTHPDRKAWRQGVVAMVKELASATTRMARIAKRVASTSVSSEVEKGGSRDDTERGDDKERGRSRGDTEKGYCAHITKVYFVCSNLILILH